MSTCLKRLALRFLAWLAGDDVARTAEVRVLAAERDAAEQAPSTLQETRERLSEGKF
jgi:hypothetical protein